MERLPGRRGDMQGAQLIVEQTAALLCLLIPNCSPQLEGTISGTVLNGSRSGEPVAGATVILQAFDDGDWAPIAQTETSTLGWYSFDGLPLSDQRLLRVAATHDDVFYPGSRVRLNSAETSYRTSLRVFDSTTGPSPLVARLHEIAIQTQPNLLMVTETVVVSNPSDRCYIGGAENPNRPVTLRLAIPKNFEKVTFQKEYFGRRFTVIDGVLLTTVPWPPGDRELSFTYVVPLECRSVVFNRPLDLSCSDVRVTVLARDHGSVLCNLAPGDQGAELSFRSNGELLPAGHVIRIDLNHLSVPFAVSGRWAALGALLCGALAALVIALLRWKANGSIQTRRSVHRRAA